MFDLNPAKPAPLGDRPQRPVEPTQLGRAAALLVLHVTSLGCAGAVDRQPAEAIPWDGTSTTEGPVTTVRTHAGSVWQSAELVETTSVGSLTGEDAYAFSHVQSVAATDDRLYVLDGPVATVRVYDLAGRHLFDIGRPGDGPGELRRPTSLAIVGARLLVRDQAQGRVHEFSLDGELLEDFRATGGGRMTVTDEGVAYLQGWILDANGELDRLGFLPFGGDGTETPVPLPAFPADARYVPPVPQLREQAAFTAAQQGLTINVNEIPFEPYLVWALADDTSMLSGIPSDYAIESRRPDGTTLRIEKDFEPVALQADEARWYRDRLVAFWRELLPEFVWQAGDLPATKRAYMSLIPDRDGRVWAVREIAGERIAGCAEDPEDLSGFFERPCWRQPYVMEGFDRDGRYLGQVALPDGIRFDALPYIDGNQVVAVLEDEAGVITVRRFRLEPNE